jgi:hypothetical protein
MVSSLRFRFLGSLFFGDRATLAGLVGGLTGLTAFTVTILVDSLAGGALGKRCRRFAFTGGDGGE